MVRSKTVRRQTERLTSQRIDTLSSTSAPHIMHTCDDSETLVRMIIMISTQGLENIDADIAGFFQWMISVHLNSKTIRAPSLAVELDGPIPLQEITSGIGRIFQNSATGVEQD